MTASRRTGLRLAMLVGGVTVALASGSMAQPPAKAKADTLSAGFANPPNSARPRVWWHWMDGNVTKDGIGKDLDWMSRVGIGGLQAFDAAILTPQVVPNRLIYMSPQWKDAFGYAATLADAKGLEFAIAASPGWSETGGPWVKPEDGMKKLVWSETIVEGGSRVGGVLAAPPRASGPFADEAVADNVLLPASDTAPTFYRDALVLAYPLPDLAGADPVPRVTLADGSSLDAAILLDGRITTGATLPKGPVTQPTTVTLAYAAPVTVRAFTIAADPAGRAWGRPTLEVEDGSGWRKLAEPDLTKAPQVTVSFTATTARRFRLVFTPFPVGGATVTGAPGAVTGQLPRPAPKPTFMLTEARLQAEPKLNNFETKAGFSTTYDYFALDAGAPEQPGVDPSNVVDLTGKMSSDGRLDWTAPPGRWKVLRLGYSLTGKTNHPASREATGLEVDKYDAGAVRRYLETYLSMYRDAAGPGMIGGKGVRALLTDSTEVGASNWSKDMIGQFQRLRGYDPRPWLPVLTGAVIGSTAQSNAFLYDFRRTLGELMASEHYGVVAKVAHENGLTLYGESLEGGHIVLGDDMAMRRYADIPMAAFWTYPASAGPSPYLIGDMKGAASVAHIYGQNLTAAESLTASLSPWAFAPHDLKKFIDLEFAFGINRPVIHTSVHQPLDRPPGFSLFYFGQYFNRLDTWAEMARPWVDYMARSSFLLQQGRNHADIAYFVGEERPAAEATLQAQGELPRSYAFDLVDAGSLLGALKVEGDELVASGGARYRILYLGGTSQRMTVPVLKKLADLAAAGATIVGARPTSSPSLADKPGDFKALADRLWSGAIVTPVGRGKVIASRDAGQALRDLGVGPDFVAEAGEVLFLHRTLPDGEIYFLNNRKGESQRLEARFRVTGLAPEIWRADTGRNEPVSYRIERGQTVVPLNLAAEDAVFVVFRKRAKVDNLTVAERTWSKVLAIEGAWEVSFQQGRGAPASARMTTLAPLNESADAGIKYFSGVATYRTTFKAPNGAAAKRPLMIDLGAVGDIAEVLVNGKLVGTPWKAPFQVDVSRAVRPGLNILEVRVADLWVNRLIGDQQPGAQKLTFTTLATYTADAPLRPAGLIGPVELRQGR